jgi:twitching motility two-component system response regulator PilH
MRHLQRIVKNALALFSFTIGDFYTPPHLQSVARCRTSKGEKDMPAVRKILCVDDAAPDLMNIEKILTAAGYMVSSAANGSDAVAKAAAEKPDLIFMDVNMPVMDGFQATRTLSNGADTKLIPVVLVTAKDQKADRVWAQMLGVRGYITKPYTPEQILDTVRACG